MQRSDSLRLTTAQIQKVDAKTVAQGIDSFALMCTAGKAVTKVTVDILKSVIDERLKNPATDASHKSSIGSADNTSIRILIAAGPENNGSDGAIAASYLGLGFKQWTGQCTIKSESIRASKCTCQQFNILDWAASPLWHPLSRPTQ